MDPITQTPSFESYLRLKHWTLNMFQNFYMIMLNLLVNNSSLLLLKNQNQNQIHKNEKLKNFLLKIHELSSRESPLKKLLGLRDFGALAMHHLEMVAWTHPKIKIEIYEYMSGDYISIKVVGCPLRLSNPPTATTLTPCTQQKTKNY